MKGYIRWANILFLTVLMANFVLPPGTVHRALADDPPPPPSEGPLSGNFIENTWIDIHERLFGQVSSGEHTAFYRTTEVIKGVGRYWGVNNVGVPFVLDVIRHYHITDTKYSEEMTNSRLNEIAATREQLGVVWARMSTNLGFANVVAASMASADSPTTSSTAWQGIVPMFDHDALLDFYVPVYPDITPSTLQFYMFAEGYDPNAVNAFDEPDWNSPPNEWAWTSESALDGDGELCATVHRPNGGWYTWCPAQDPAIQLARTHLAICLAAALAGLLLAIGAAVGGLGVGSWICAETVAPLAIAACLGAVAAGALIAVIIAAVAYAAAVATCFAYYWASYNAAAEAAHAAGCHSGS